MSNGRDLSLRREAEVLSAPRPSPNLPSVSTPQFGSFFAIRTLRRQAEYLAGVAARDGAMESVIRSRTRVAGALLELERAHTPFADIDFLRQEWRETGRQEAMYWREEGARRRELADARHQVEMQRLRNEYASLQPRQLPPPAPSANNPAALPAPGMIPMEVIEETIARMPDLSEATRATLRQAVSGLAEETRAQRR